MEREQCARCAMKHLAQARVLLLETRQGYPQHVWYAIGHMAEAADEIAEIMPAQAAEIRRNRLKIEDSLRRSDRDPAIDWKTLMTNVATEAMLEETLTKEPA
jgi:hypothetical protein